MDGLVPPKPLRADAQRNRDRLLVVAAAAFAAEGGAVALEAVAREAGLGIGTLYRHFPTRESLVEAVYAAGLDDLVTAVPALLERLGPLAALREWMSRYAAFAATKAGMVEVLRASWAAGRLVAPTTRERLAEALQPLLEAGVRAGVLRGDVSADDLTRLMLGVSIGVDGGQVEQMGRLLGLVVDALVPRGGPPA